MYRLSFKDVIFRPEIILTSSCIMIIAYVQVIRFKLDYITYCVFYKETK